MLATIARLQFHGVTKVLKDLAFDDVLINPSFSEIESRADVDLSADFLGMKLKLPILSANMDTITGSKMAAALAELGCVGALHRFMDVQKNKEEFLASIILQETNELYNKNPIVSVGLGESEYERAMALFGAGATHLLIDVAHGASIGVVKQYDLIRGKVKDNAAIIVGNFANAESIHAFNLRSASSRRMDSAKVGIGGGSMCTTRIVTGCGRSTLSSILDCVSTGIPIIGDGGFRTSGDVAKALAAGAQAVMLGGMFAGTRETPAFEQNVDAIFEPLLEANKHLDPSFLRRKAILQVTYNGEIKYRGSASQESYVVQGKVASHRSAEGESTTVKYKGPVKDVVQQIEGGLRSAMTYVGAHNYEEFRKFAELVEISGSTVAESRAHGKK
jgi:IMP dehydrogenase